MSQVYNQHLSTRSHLLSRSLGIVCALVVAVTTGCSGGRIAIPPGEIPVAEMPSSEDEQYGQEVLAELSREYPLDNNDDRINRVRDIVMDLARAANADKDPWHVYVLQGDNVVNAAATRGNYVFVWTGMLSKTTTKGELATVLAHELGHVLAKHTQPTASEEVGEILGEVSGQVTQQILIGSGYGAFADIAGILVASAIQALAVNPQSQRSELEADHIGFFLMADAGYNPEEALTLWQKMATSHTADLGIINFLSSHPASDERLEELRRMLPEAMARYRKEVRPSIPGGVAAAPGTLPPGDSFAIPGDNPGAKQPPVSQKPSPQPKPITTGSKNPEEWEVVEPSTNVLEEPKSSGRFVSKLKKGDRVIVTTREGRWFRVTYPVEGYVFGPDLSPP